MSTQLLAAFAELEARLATISTAGGFQTDLGAAVLPAGTYLDEDDAPCVALYEAAPDEQGLMKLAALDEANACGLDFQVNYVAQAFVRRGEPQSALAAAEAVAADMMRALMGSNHGALDEARGHRITGRARGLTVKGANVIPVQVFGTFRINEKVYE